MKRLSMASVVVVVSVLVGSVASASAPAPEGDATPACAAAGEEHTSREATPECRYLERCCAGNTPNAPKCCSAYFKKCGRGPGE